MIHRPISGLVRRHIVGFPQIEQILVDRNKLVHTDRGEMLRVAPEDRVRPEDITYVGHVLSQKYPRQPDGSCLVPVERTERK